MANFEGTYVSSIGRRKTAIAQVRLYKRGGGNIVVNGMPYKEYFGAQSYRDKVLSPLIKVGMSETADIEIKTVGGGRKGQADAICLGIARALAKMDDTLKLSLKSDDLLTRDSRIKERMKPGHRKARRSPQWSKR
mgnify:CR=1 FL=1